MPLQSSSLIGCLNTTGSACTDILIGLLWPYGVGQRFCLKSDCTSYLGEVLTLVKKLKK